jgi:hypothetical protein
MVLEIVPFRISSSGILLYPVSICHDIASRPHSVDARMSRNYFTPVHTMRPENKACLHDDFVGDILDIMLAVFRIVMKV